ncbi:MAG: ribonuclease R [Lysobacterales bacterium]
MAPRQKSKTSKKSKPFVDPKAAQEQARYDKPIASRAAILMLLEQRGELMKRSHIAKALDITDDDGLEALRRRLRAMVRDGELIQNRRGGYGVAQKLEAKPGRVIGHPDGFGFLALDEGGDDWYLSPRWMRGVLHGDRVLARVQGIDHRNRTEGAIVSVLERANSHLVGRFYRESGVAFVTADEKRINQDILIPPDAAGEASSGDFVYLELTEQPDRRHKAVGRVVEVLGRSINAPMAVEVAIRSHDIPFEWPAQVSAATIPDHVDKADWEGRKDLRQLPLVTIDGFDAKDFDDAVHCKPKPRGGWTVTVAIADVSNYVRPGTPLDDEAKRRSTSVYFPNRVIPMLPEGLSNGICSLRPKVDRLCLVCEMQVNAEGKVTRSRFYRAVMHSHARLTYQEAWQFLDRDPAAPALAPEVADSLQALNDVYRAFRRQRNKRGAIDFRGREVYFKFNDAGEVAEIEPSSRNDAHKIIEECMIAANVQAALTLEKAEVPCAFRVHPPPQERKLEDLRGALGELAIKLPPADRLRPKHLSDILGKASERPEQALIESLVLRSQSLAVYQPNNAGHFGLALKAYAHFTSPIRRYPDLMVHRALIALSEKGTSGKADKDAVTAVARQCEHAGMAERRAEDASRDVDERLKCAYMLSHLGEEFEGLVTGVREFGLFVELNGLGVSGLAHVTTLPNDYYQFDPLTHTLTGDKHRRSYRLGDQVSVQVLRVDTDDRQVDFGIAGKAS